MTTATATACDTVNDRRQDVRLAGGGPLEAVVIDDNGQPITVIRDVHVINVSAGGLAIVTTTDVAPGSIVSAQAGEAGGPDAPQRKIKLQALECSQQKDRRNRVRLRLIDGRMPAQLIYRW